MRWAIELASVALFQTASATPIFQPPVGRPLILSIEQRREEAGRAARTTLAERQIVFHRSRDGWRADVTHHGARSDQPGDAFSRAIAAAAAAPIVFRLDPNGHVTGIDDIDGVWARLVASMQANVGEAAAAPLNALPSERRSSMLASMLSGAIDAEAAGEGPTPSESITIPAAPIGGIGTPAPLPGTRTVTRERDRLHIHIRAAGPLPQGHGATSLIERDIRLNPLTGLVMEQRERVENRLESGALAHARYTVTRIRYLDTRRESRR